MTERTEVLFRNQYYVDVGDFQSHRADFHSSESHRFHLRDNVGTELEDIHCDAYSETLPFRAVGCWETALYDVIKTAWFDGDNVLPGAGVPLSQQAAVRFGEQVSITKENVIKQLLIDTVLLSSSERQTKWAEFEATLDDITISGGAGRITGIIGTELPRHIFSADSVKFDAPDGIKLENFLPSDSSGNAFTLVIPVNWKATVSMVSEATSTRFENSMQINKGDETGREQITNTAKGTYSLPISTWDEFYAKLNTADRRFLEIVFVKEA